MRVLLIPILMVACSAGGKGSDEADSGGTTPSAATFEVLPPDATIGGMTLAEAGADWWRWALEHPVPHHPVLDETGVDCEETQPADVFYLAGTFTGAPSVERTCVTSHPGPFLIPIVNSEWDNCGTATSSLQTDQALIDGINAQLDQVDSASLTIDGVQVGATAEDFAEYRTDVNSYSFDSPQDSIYALWGFPFEGLCDPSYAAGYYIPFTLEPGDHNVVVHGGMSYYSFSVDVHYLLTVE